MCLVLAQIVCASLLLLDSILDSRNLPLALVAADEIVEIVRTQADDNEARQAVTAFLQSLERRGSAQRSYTALIIVGLGCGIVWLVLNVDQNEARGTEIASS